METFKKAMVSSAAVAIFAAGAYIGLQGFTSTLQDKFAEFLAKREASVQSTDQAAK